MYTERMFSKGLMRVHCMKVEKALYEDGTEKWVLVDHDFKIVEEVVLFSSYLYASDYSPNTIEGYLRDIKSFMVFLRDKELPFLSVEPLHIPEYVACISGLNENGIGSKEIRCNTTINRMLAAVASCYNYHVKVLNTIQKSPFIGIRTLRPTDAGKSFLHHASMDKSTVDKSLFYRRISKAQIKRLMRDQINDAYEGFTTKRDRLLFKVLYYTGIRIGELLGLQIDDYETPDNNKQFGAVFVVERRSNKPHQRQKTGNRVVHVPMSLLFEIDEYVTLHRPYIKEVNSIFVADKGKQRGQALTRKSVEKAFKACTKRTSIKFTPHMLRHTHFSELAEFGYDEAFMMARGGWKSINSASVYLHISPEAQRNAFERFWEGSHIAKFL